MRVGVVLAGLAGDLISYNLRAFILKKRRLKMAREKMIFRQIQSRAIMSYKFQLLLFVRLVEIRMGLKLRKCSEAKRDLRTSIAHNCY